MRFSATSPLGITYYCFMCNSHSASRLFFRSFSWWLEFSFRCNLFESARICSLTEGVSGKFFEDLFCYISSLASFSYKCSIVCFYWSVAVKIQWEWEEFCLFQSLIMPRPRVMLLQSDHQFIHSIDSIPCSDIKYNFHLLSVVLMQSRTLYLS